MSYKMLLKDQLHFCFHFCFHLCTIWNITTTTTILKYSLVFRIIPINMSNAIERVVISKSGNTDSWRLKSFQVKYNNSQQIIIVIFNKVLKCLDKNLIKWPIQKAFIWGIINKQGILAHAFKYLEKKTSKFLWKTCFSRLEDKKWTFFM